VRIYTDGSSIDGGVGAAAIMYRGGTRKKTTKKHLGKSTEHTVYEAEVVGIAMALEMTRVERNVVRVVIAVDNRAAIQALELRRPATGHYLVDAIHEGARRVRERHGRGTQILVRWIPGHEGVKGNEECNTEAKKAAGGRSSRPELLPQEIRGILPVSRAAAKQEFEAGLKARAREEFETSPRCAKIRRIDTSAPSNKFRKATENIPRKHASLLIQLRTGHVALNHHLFRTKCAPSPKCPKCPNKDETVHHYLISCPTYEGYRRTLEQSLRQGARLTAVLLSNEKAFMPLFKFIHKTRRFAGIFGNLELPEKPPDGQ
jgi:ribonuclease HI